MTGHRRPSALPHRRGTSLVEMVVMMSVIGVMLGIAMTTIQLLFRAERNVTQTVWHNRQVARLSRVFRDDVHAASGSAVQPAEGVRPATLALNAVDGRQITYTIQEHELTRVVPRGEDEPPHRNSFFLPPGSSLRFETAGESPETVRLVIRRSQLGTRQPGTADRHAPEDDERRVLTMEAQIGRDLRFVASGESNP